MAVQKLMPRQAPGQVRGQIPMLGSALFFGTKNTHQPGTHRELFAVLLDPASSYLRRLKPFGMCFFSAGCHAHGRADRPCSAKNRSSTCGSLSWEVPFRCFGAFAHIPHKARLPRQRFDLTSCGSRDEGVKHDNTLRKKATPLFRKTCSSRHQQSKRNFINQEEKHNDHATRLNETSWMGEGLQILDEREKVKKAATKNTYVVNKDRSNH